MPTSYWRRCWRRTASEASLVVEGHRLQSLAPVVWSHSYLGAMAAGGAMAVPPSDRQCCCVTELFLLTQV